MGPKITVDSATLMNKGLEVIEAHFLFGIPYESIDVVVHPQSIIHSMVEFRDGAVMAQLGTPDMRLPIAYALNYPKRRGPAWADTDLLRIGSLTFEPVDKSSFPCLALAYRAGSLGGTAPAALNAANEVAVQAFLERRIGFEDIPRLLAEVLEVHVSLPVDGIDLVETAEAEARKLAESLLDGGS
jgi:1-deoxy-D-xylulose-5-phosphate reductoisomerase